MNRIELLLVFVFFGCILASFAAPSIGQFSPTALPGDIFRIHGEDLGTNPTVFAQSKNNGNTETQLEIISFIDDVINARIPEDWFMDVYQMQVANDDKNSRSAPFYLNKPFSTQLDMSEVNVGAKFRIFGKNLYFPRSDVTPIVHLIDKNNQTLDAQIDKSSSDQFILSVYAPDNIVDGEEYWIEVDNGYGVSTIIDPTIVGRRGTDLFETGVGWTVVFANFTQKVVELLPSGNSSADDVPRFRAALGAVREGGIIKLRAGEFYFHTCGTQIPSNLIIQGDGVDKTIIYYARDCTNNKEDLFFSFDFLNNFAIVDISFKNIGQVQTEHFHSTRGVNQMMYLRVNIDLNHGTFFYMGGSRVLLSDLHVTSNSSLNGDFTFSGYGFGCNTREMIVRRSSFFYETAQMDLRFSSNVVMEDSSFVRDQKYQTLYPTKIYNFRGMSLAFVNNMVFLRNRMETLNSDPITSLKTNDGETFGSESGGPYPALTRNLGRGVLGNVTLATPWTIYDPYNDITDMFYSQYLDLNIAIAIVGGTGKGQVRKVKSAYSNGTIVIDRPWGIVPQTDSYYSVTMSSSNWLFKDNEIIGWAKTVQLYLARVSNMTMVGNKFHNSAGVITWPNNRILANSTAGSCDQATFFNKPAYFVGFTYEIFFLDNTLYMDTTNNSMLLGIFGMSAGTLSELGMVISGSEMRNNSMVRSGPISSAPEGIFMTHCYNGHMNGIIAQGNSFSNTGGFFMSQQYGTVIACSKTVQLTTNNITMPNCGQQSQLYGLKVFDDHCTSSNIKWSVPKIPSNTPVNSSSRSILSWVLILLSVSL